MGKGRDAHLKDLWKLGLFFYLVAFNYPLLEAFNLKTPFLGIPLLVLFLFGGWLLAIWLTFLFVRRLRRDLAEEEALPGDCSSQFP